MTYQKEFPDFDPATMPAIPAGFDDVSWHNDTCPSFRNEALKLTLFVDYANATMREFPQSVRFSLVREEWPIVSDSDRAHLAESDDWSAILAAIKRADIFTPIEATRAAAEAWLAALAASDFNYHLDDSPETIINGRTGKALFTAEQCKAVSANLDTIVSVMDWDSVWEFYYAECQKRDDF